MRPRLRPVETIVVPDGRFGQAIMLRDTEGVTARVATVPAPLVPVLARFTGELTIAEIAAEAATQTGAAVPVALVEKLASDLDLALFLDSPRYRAERAKIEREFLASTVRRATHAGGAYHDDPKKLRAYLERDCIESAGVKEANGSVRGLVAPHIDPWRGKLGYGHAYGALRAGLSDEVDTFVLLGTSHAPMREPFALCRKAFDTPLGQVDADLAAIDEIAARAAFDPFADVFNHKREHSLEFQAVFVRYLLPHRKIRIIPILCGMGENQRSGEIPEDHRPIEGFLSAVRAVVERRAHRTVVIAGADLAHTGPRFGDAAAYDEEDRAQLERTDRASLELATAQAHREFFAHVQGDLDTRRVCGLGPIYTLLKALPPGCRGELEHYEQTIDPDEGSIVSHAAVVFYG
ncbi:MAG TPA: AmmeMemoRadiSam system protein B [Polyangiaceae bacterium]|nr:AmmeMemoRadiSam system protein B [Polyangiaceae bacterium]